MKLHNLGEKNGAMMGVAEVDKSKVWYPSITLSEDQLPGVKKLQVGDAGTMQIKYKVTSIRAREDKTEKTYEVGFELTAAGLEGEKNGDKKKYAKEIAEGMK